MNTRDSIGGAVIAAIGGFFAVESLWLDLGTAFQMGPGYFPLVLAIVMIGLGLVIMAGAFRTAPASIGSLVPLRGILIVTATPVIFGLVVRGLGLLPAVALIAFVSIYASRRANLGRAALLSAGLTAFCVLVFHYGLGLPVSLFGNWIG